MKSCIESKVNWTISGYSINMHKKNEVKWIEGSIKCVNLGVQLGPSELKIKEVS
jgi:hypothetical protein